MDANIYQDIHVGEFSPEKRRNSDDHGHYGAENTQKYIDGN